MYDHEFLYHLEIVISTYVRLITDNIEYLKVIEHPKLYDLLSTCCRLLAQNYEKADCFSSFSKQFSKPEIV